MEDMRGNLATLEASNNQCILPSQFDILSCSEIVSQNTPPPTRNHSHSSVNCDMAVEEQLSWVDDLLDEPDLPVLKGHYQSSSDSVAFSDAPIGIDKNIGHRIDSIPPGFRPINLGNDSWNASPFNICPRPIDQEVKNQPWEPPSYARVLVPCPQPKKASHIVGNNSHESDASFKAIAKQNLKNFGAIDGKDYKVNNQDQSAMLAGKNGSHAKLPTSVMDSKRTKQYVFFKLVSSNSNFYIKIN